MNLKILNTAKYEIIYSVWFYLHDVQNQEKLNHILRHKLSDKITKKSKEEITIKVRIMLSLGGE